MGKCELPSLSETTVLVHGLKNLVKLPWLGGAVGWSLLPTPKGGGFDSGQGTYLGCGLDPQSRGVRRQVINVSLSFPPFFPSLLFFLSKFNGTYQMRGEKKQKKKNSC